MCSSGACESPLCSSYLTSTPTVCSLPQRAFRLCSLLCSATTRRLAVFCGPVRRFGSSLRLAVELARPFSTFGASSSTPGAVLSSSPCCLLALCAAVVRHLQPLLPPTLLQLLSHISIPYTFVLCCDFLRYFGCSVIFLADYILYFFPPIYVLVASPWLS